MRFFSACSCKQHTFDAAVTGCLTYVATARQVKLAVAESDLLPMLAPGGLRTKESLQRACEEVFRVPTPVVWPHTPETRCLCIRR